MATVDYNVTTGTSQDQKGLFIVASAQGRGTRDWNVGRWLEDERLVKAEGWRDLCGRESVEGQVCI